jgi:hypothetical protein
MQSMHRIFPASKANPDSPFESQAISPFAWPNAKNRRGDKSRRGDAPRL